MKEKDYLTGKNKAIMGCVDFRVKIKGAYVEGEIYTKFGPTDIEVQAFGFDKAGNALRSASVEDSKYHKYIGRSVVLEMGNISESYLLKTIRVSTYNDEPVRFTYYFTNSIG